jgi:hypothetical protein
MSLFPLLFFFLFVLRVFSRPPGVYGPPLGKRCLVMIDDLNMPREEGELAGRKEYSGEAPPLELLRQALTYGQWPDLRTLDSVRLVDINVRLYPLSPLLARPLEVHTADLSLRSVNAGAKIIRHVDSRYTP